MPQVSHCNLSLSCDVYAFSLELWVFESFNSVGTNYKSVPNVKWKQSKVITQMVSHSSETLINQWEPEASTVCETGTKCDKMHASEAFKIGLINCTIRLSFFSDKPYGIVKPHQSKCELVNTFYSVEN